MAKTNTMSEAQIKALLIDTRGDLTTAEYTAKTGLPASQIDYRKAKYKLTKAHGCPAHRMRQDLLAAYDWAAARLTDLPKTPSGVRERIFCVADQLAEPFPVLTLQDRTLVRERLKRHFMPKDINAVECDASSGALMALRLPFNQIAQAVL